MSDSFTAFVVTSKRRLDPDNPTVWVFFFEVGMNELSLLKPEEKVMTTKEVAEILNVTPRTIQQTVEKLGLAKSISQVKIRGQNAFVFNEAQVTAIKLELENHSKVNALSPKTQLEKQLLIQQAMQLQQEMITELQQRAEVAENALARIESGTGCFSIAQTAKALKLPYGRNTLFDKLKQMHLLTDYNEPYQDQINAKHFKVVSKVCADGKNHIVPLVTGKGLVYLAKKFNTEIDESISADA